MRKAILSLLAFAWIVLAAGCNTMAGMGRDIRGGGQAIEGAAEKTKDRI
jgi:predicted small secreted protein